MLNPKNGEDAAEVPSAPPVVAARRIHESRDSPALPKRHPVKRLESLDPPKESIHSSDDLVFESCLRFFFFYLFEVEMMAFSKLILQINVNVFGSW